MLKLVLWAGLTLLAALGAGAVLWLVFGRLVAPVGEALWLVVPAAGDGGRLEQDLAGARWLGAAGLARFRVAVVDLGLDADGLRLAGHLGERWPETAFCRPEELPALLGERPGPWA